MLEKPKAVRRLKKLDNGTMGVVFVSAISGEEIPPADLGAYDVIEQGGTDLKGLGINPVEDATPKDESDETTSEKIIESSTDGDNANNSISPTSGKGSTAKKSIDDSIESTKGNYGYMDKPGVLGVAAAFGVPGAKIVGTAINAKNTHAIGKAREEAGLEPRGVFEKAKGVLAGQGTYVGDAIINDKQYGVGLDALGPSGRTMLTPSEARKRGLAYDGVETATRDQTREAMNAFKESGQAIEGSTGILSGAKDAIGNFFNNLFDRGEDRPSNNAVDTTQYAGEDFFPDAPTEDVTVAAPVDDITVESLENYDGVEGSSTSGVGGAVSTEDNNGEASMSEEEAAAANSSQANNATSPGLF